MRAVYVTLLFFGAVAAQDRYRLCAPRTTISDNTCIQVQRGDSQVSCVRVEDSSECAIKLNQGEADFGVFTAEEALITYQFYPSDTQVVAQLKHPSRISETYEYQKVAIVRSTYTQGSPNDLQQGGFCHSGFSQDQVWTDNIQKFFERKVYNNTCDSNLSAAENEALNLRNYFGTACRPGNWVTDSSQDAVLKQKYPELCAACDNSSTCRYSGNQNNGDIGALNCLVSGRGNVSYVTLRNVYDYFSITNDILYDTTNTLVSDQLFTNYRFLCPNFTLVELSSPNPCAWVQQPWSIVSARNVNAAALQERLKTWLTPDPATETVQDWITALRSILERGNAVQFLPELQNLTTYLSPGRELNVMTTSCGKTIRWCTVSRTENNKCNWIAEGAKIYGIQPNISCAQANNSFDCFRNIANNTADIITIDSNYGHLARQVYNLSTVLYTETETDKNSVIIAVVREGATYNVSSFASIRQRGACFPEYGGIAWLSFINAARLNNVITDSCDYSGEVSNLVSGACTPGIGDRDHTNSTGGFSSKLCSLCPIENNNSSCSANSSNIFYGDRGALECLSSRAGDVAFIEVKNILEYVNSGVINGSQFRVLCRNGTLASYTGLIVDDLCALSVTIDSEVMGRSSRSSIDTNDTVSALLSIENWFGYRTYALRPIHVYGPFNGTRDLLFKDSTTGLETTDSTLRAVLAYKELFAHFERCTGSGSIHIFASLSTVLLLYCVHYL